MVYVWDDEQGLLTYPYSEFSYAYREDPKGKYQSIYGTRLAKIKRFQYDEKGLYESDVSRETRVLTDLYLNDDTPSKNHRIGYFDIEVSSVGGFASVETANKEVTAIGYYDSGENVFYVFILDPEGRIASREYDRKGKKTYVISCPTEFDLLESFMGLYTSIMPTILTGWNIDGYDVPYLYNRLRQILGKEMANNLSPIGIVTYNEHREKFQIAGVSTVDYLPLYKKYTYTERPNYQLNTIGLAELGRGKVQYEGTLDELYRNDIDTFIEYNLEDVDIVVGLEEKLKMIELIRFICHLGHVQYEDYAYSSKFIEGTILTYLHRKGLIAPNKPEGGREAFNAKMESNDDDFEGAFVKPPYPGLYEWTYSLDLASLYPSIIMTLNISPETKVGRVTNWNPEEHIRGTISSYTVIEGDKSKHMSRDEFDAFMEERAYNISSNGILYRTDKTGIVPEILDLWFRQRKEYKGLMFKYNQEGNTELGEYYDRRQHVQKILLNSVYGVLGLSIFRFYDLDNASAVTLSGQDVIRSSAKFINGQYAQMGIEPKQPTWLRQYETHLRNDYKQPKLPEETIQYCLNAKDHCVYIDTDSVYFSSAPVLKGTTDEEKLQETIALAYDMEKKLNKFYDAVAKKFFNCSTHRLSIKAEAVSRTALWIRKKRYALNKIYNLEESTPMKKVAPKGLDIVRSSFPEAYKKFMKGVLEDILNLKGKEDIDKQILAFREEMPKMNYLKIARNTSVKDISKHETPTWTRINVFNKGAPAHVKAAIAYNRLLKHFGRDTQFQPIRDGDKVKYVFLTKNQFGLDTLAVKTYDDPPEILALVEKHIDYDALFERELEKKLIKFYETMGWGDLPTEVNQLAYEFFDFN